MQPRRRLALVQLLLPLVLLLPLLARGFVPLPPPSSRRLASMTANRCVVGWFDGGWKWNNWRMDGVPCGEAFVVLMASFASPSITMTS